MNFFTLNINSEYKTLGTNDSFQIRFEWPLTYSSECIKVLRVVPPTSYSNLKGNVVYVTSDIIEGTDSGYFPIANPNISSAVIAVIEPTKTYIATKSEPFFVCRGTYFGRSYGLPQPYRTIILQLQNPDGSFVGAQDNWNITIVCYNNIVSNVKITNL